jgi:tetratricopeptide (TPR) repeat protein
MSLNNLGNLAMEQGDHTKARALYSDSLALKREIGDKRGIALSLSKLAYVAQKQADYAEAEPLYLESLVMSQELGDKLGVCLSLIGLGKVVTEAGSALRGAHCEEPGCWEPHVRC